MPLTRRHVLELSLGLPLALSAGCGEGEPDPITERALGEELFQKASRWLWAKQHKDGAFRSEVHDRLSTGQLLTPLVLLHTTNIPRDNYDFPRNDALRGVDWILKNVAKNGALGFATGTPELPVRATSLAIHAIWRLRPRRFGDKSYPLLWWLRRQQLTADRGWEGHPAQGGFPVGTWLPPEPPQAGRVELSTTRVAVQAIAAMQVHANDPAMKEARAYAERCRRSDGSYVPTPAASDPRGDGAATADGLQILVANRLEDEELLPRVEPLDAMHRPDGTPRVARDTDPRRFSYRAGAATVFEWTGGPAGWADALIRTLAEEQDPKGFWQNPAGGHDEDDPIVATSFALTAIGSALRSWPRLEDGPRR